MPNCDNATIRQCQIARMTNYENAKTENVKMLECDNTKMR